MKFFFIALLLLNTSLLYGQSAKPVATDSGYAEVNGTKLFYETAGNGEVIVFVHGSFGDRRHWDLQFFELSKKFKVVRFDLRGFGRSANPDSITVYRDADDLSALMDHLKISKANICGLSSGSFVVIDFALAYPEKCISLIPVGPRVAGDESGEFRTPATDSLRTAVLGVVNILKSKGRKEAIEHLWNSNNPLANSVRSSATRKRLLTMGGEYSWWRYLHPTKKEYAYPMAIKNLGTIKIPTLIVTADHDIEKCREVAQILVKGIPGAKLISIKGAGHIMNMDKPKEFNRSITEFIVRSINK